MQRVCPFKRMGSWAELFQLGWGRPLFFRPFIYTLAIAVAFSPTPVLALRQLSPEQTPSTQSGLEEALGAAKSKGIVPAPDLLAQLSDPSMSRIQDVSQLPKLNRDIGAVGEVLEQVRGQVDWASYKGRRLDDWSSLAKSQHDLMVGFKRTRHSGYSEAEEQRLSRRATQSALVVESIAQFVPDFQVLIGGASSQLEAVADDGRISSFAPQSADLMGKILQARDVKRRHANFLVAFEVRPEKGGSARLYILEGLLDELRKRPNGAVLVKALLANAGTELYFLHLWDEFKTLGSVQGYLRAFPQYEQELYGVYQELAHLISEDLERFALGIPFLGPDDQVNPDFLEEYSELDHVISDFVHQRPETPEAARVIPPPPEPAVPLDRGVAAPELVPVPAGPEVLSRARPRRAASGVTQGSIDRFKSGWRSWVEANVDHGLKRLWDEEGLTVGLPLAEELSEQTGLSKSSITQYGQAARKKEENPNLMPLRTGARSYNVLGDWIAGYNGKNSTTPISHPPEGLFETYTNVADVIAADGIRRQTEAGRFERLMSLLRGGQHPDLEPAVVQSRIEALNRLFEFVGGVPPIPISFAAPAAPPSALRVPTPALPLPPAKPPPVPEVKAEAVVVREPIPSQPLILVTGWSLSGTVPEPTEMLRFNMQRSLGQRAYWLYRLYVEWLNRYNHIPPTRAEMFDQALKKRTVFGREFNGGQLAQTIDEARRVVPQDGPVPLDLFESASSSSVRLLVAAHLAQRHQAPDSFAAGEVWIPPDWDFQRLRRTLKEGESALDGVAAADPVLRGLLDRIRQTPAERVSVSRSTPAQPKAKPAAVPKPATPPAPAAKLPAPPKPAQPPAAKPTPTATRPAGSAAVPLMRRAPATPPPRPLVDRRPVPPPATSPAVVQVPPIPVEDPNAPALTLITPAFRRPSEKLDSEEDLPLDVRVLYRAYVWLLTRDRHWGQAPEIRQVRGLTTVKDREWTYDRIRRIQEAGQTKLPPEAVPIFIFPNDTEEEPFRQFVNTYLAMRSNPPLPPTDQIPAPAGWNGRLLKDVVTQRWSMLHQQADPILRDILNRIARTPADQIRWPTPPTPPAAPVEPLIIPLEPTAVVHPPLVEEISTAAPPAAEEVETPAEKVVVLQEPAPERPLAEHFRYWIQQLRPDNLGDFGGFLGLIASEEEKVFVNRQKQTKRAVPEKVKEEERRAAYGEIEGLFNELLQSEADRFISALDSDEEYGWIQDWPAARAKMQEVMLGKLGPQPALSDYRGRAERWVSDHAAELAVQAQQVRPGLFGRANAPAQDRLTTSGHRQVLAELFRMLGQVQRSGVDLHLPGLGGEEGLKELLGSGAVKAGPQVGLLPALGLTPEGLSRSSSPVTVIKSAPEPARRGGRGTGSHEASTKDQGDFVKRMAAFRVARHILTHKATLRLVIGDWERRSDQPIRGDWQDTGASQLGIFKGIPRESVREEVKVLRDLLVSGRLSGLFVDESAPAAAVDDSFDDLFRGWYEVDLPKVLKSGSTREKPRINFKAFPSQPDMVKKVSALSRELGTRRVTEIFTRLRRGGNSYNGYIEKWVEHKIATGELTIRAGLEQTPEAALQRGLQLNGGVLRLDGLTFGYSQDGELQAAVVPDLVIPLAADQPGRMTLLILSEATQRQSGIRILDQLGLPPEMIPVGVERVPVSADPQQARVELAGVGPSDVWMASTDLTDGQIADLLPPGVKRPTVIRLGPGVADAIRPRGPSALEELIWAAGLEQNHSLTVWNVDQVTFRDYAVTVVTIDRAA